jgi:hypothetical protein
VVVDAARAWVTAPETALGERDGQVRTLTAAVQREQQGREDDARHWLARLEEQRGALTDARAREGLLVAEKRALMEEVGRLRREVKRLRSPPPLPEAGEGEIQGVGVICCRPIHPSRCRPLC